MLASLSASLRNSVRIFSKISCLFHNLKREYTVCQGPKRSGKSRQGTPVFAT